MAIIRRDKRPANGSAVRGMGLSMTRANPQLAAALSKTTPGQYGASYDQSGNRTAVSNELYAFMQALQRRSQRNADADAVKKMLPDMELAEQIVVSSILSPKDMVTTELIYSASSDEFQADLLTSLINRLKQHFKVDYPIENDLMDMVREPLVTKGSYPVAVLPENAIDQLINGRRRPSMEGLTMRDLERYYDSTTGAAKPIGILGPGVAAQENSSAGKFGVSMEAFNTQPKVMALEDMYLRCDEQVFGSPVDRNIFITDNPLALKTKDVLAYLKTKRVGRTYQTAMESVGLDRVAAISDREIERFIVRKRPDNQKQVEEMPSQQEISRESVGLPLVIKFPTESVMPVHVPGNPQKHLAYYVVLDENGNPIYSPETDILGAGALNNQTSSAQSNLIQRAALNMGMADASRFDINNHMHMQALVRVYGDMVERDLINRVRNGAVGMNVQISGNEEIYRLMLSRTLARRHTQVLYLPVEYMTYIAFKYGPDGIGRSLLDEQAMISMFRTTMLFAEVIGSIKNSMGRTKVSGTLPENDPDPLGTQEKIVHEIAMSRQLNLPTKNSQPADIMSFVQQAAFEFNFSGNPIVPDLKLEFEQVQSNYQKPDSDLSQNLRKSAIMGFGLSPETVDNGFNTEFATTAAANNVLLNKRVVMWQNQFCPQLTQHMRQHARFSEQLVKDLRKILEDNADKILLDLEAPENSTINESAKKTLLVNYALQRFLQTFNVTLPQPSSVTLESQNSDLENYEKLVDLALEKAFISPDMLTETVAGKLSEQANALKALWKAYFMRRFMAEKGILTELSEILSVDNKQGGADDVGKEVVSHLQTLTRASVKMLAELKTNRDAADKDLAAIGATADGGGGGDSGDGADDFGAGGNDFDLGNEASDTDNPEEENADVKEPGNGDENENAAADDEDVAPGDEDK